MQNQIKKKNPLSITNSQLAQVQAYQGQMIEFFNKQYQGKNLPFDKDFYTNLVVAAKFSIARNFKEKDVFEMWKKWMQWYHEAKPYQISRDRQYIEKLHNTGKYRFCGKDKQGRQILVIRMKYHVKGLVNVQQNVNYMLYMLQKGRKLADDLKTHQITIIYDRREVAQSDDVSKQTMKQVQQCLNNYYPQILGVFLVLGANIIYRGLWQVVKVFVSKRTEEKIHLLSDVNMLEEYIDKENLANQYGGMLNIDKDCII